MARKENVIQKFFKIHLENLSNGNKIKHKLYLCEECNQYFKPTQDMLHVVGYKNRNKSAAENIKTPTPEPRKNQVEIPFVFYSEYMIAAAESVLKVLSQH